MGEFYGSISLRGARQAAVIAACQALHEARKLEFFVAPEHGDWVTVYPSEHGQDETVAAELARATGCPALLLAVHDGDTLSWVYYDRAARRVDQYSSSEYMLPCAGANPAECGGRPEVFADLVGPQGVAKIVQIIQKPDDSAPDTLWPARSLEALGEVFGLRKLATSFEYALEQRSDIPPRSRRVPSGDPARAQIAALKKAGLIRATLKGPNKRAHAQVWRLTDGAIGLGWSTYSLAGAGPRIESWRSPWTEPERALDLEGHAGLMLALSPTGRWAAIDQFGAGGPRIAIVDLETRATTTSLVPQRIHQGEFTSDERAFLLMEAPIVRQQLGPVPAGATDGPSLKRYSLEGALEGEWPIPLYQVRGAIDPGGRAAFASEEVFLLDLNEGWRNWLSLPERPDGQMLGALHALIVGQQAKVIRERVAAIFFNDARDILWVSTDLALRAYSWATAKHVPPAPPVHEIVFEVLAAPTLPLHPLAAHDREGSVLCAGLDGSLVSIDLTEQRARTLAVLAGQMIHQILVVDESTLLTVARAARGAEGSRVDIWDYAALREQARTREGRVVP